MNAKRKNVYGCVLARTAFGGLRMPHIAVAGVGSGSSPQGNTTRPGAAEAGDLAGWVGARKCGALGFRDKKRCVQARTLPSIVSSNLETCP